MQSHSHHSNPSHSNQDPTSHANDEVVEANQLIRERMQKRTCLGCQIFDSKATASQKEVTPMVSTDPRCHNCKVEDQLTTRKVRPRPIHFPERAYLTRMKECPNKSWQGIVSVDRQLAKNAGLDFHHLDVIIWPYVRSSDLTMAAPQDLNAICFFRNAAIWEEHQHTLRSILAQRPRVFFASEKGEQFHMDLVPSSTLGPQGGEVCHTLMYNSQAKCYVPEANHRLIKKGQAEAQRNRGADSHSQKSSSRRSSGKSQFLEAPHANQEETLSEGSDELMEVGHQEGAILSHSHSHPAMALSTSSSLLAMQLPPPLQTSASSSDEKIAAANVLASFSSSINILATLERDYFPLLNQCYHLSTLNDATFLLRVMTFHQLAPFQFFQTQEALTSCYQLLKKNWEDAKSLMDNGSLPVLKLLQFVRSLAYFSMVADSGEHSIPALDLLDDLIPRAQALNLKYVHHEPVSKLKANLERIRQNLYKNSASLLGQVAPQELPFVALQIVWNQFLMVKPSENPFLPLDLDLDNLSLDTTNFNGEGDQQQPRKIGYFIPDVNMDSFRLALVLFSNQILDSNGQPNFPYMPVSMPVPVPVSMPVPMPTMSPMAMQVPLSMSVPMGPPVQMAINYAMPVQMAMPVSMTMPMPTTNTATSTATAPTLQVPTASKPSCTQSPLPVSPRPISIKQAGVFTSPANGLSPRNHHSAFSVCISPPALPSPLPQQSMSSMSHLCLPSPSPSSALSTPRQISFSAPNSPRPSPRTQYLDDGLKPNTSERPFTGHVSYTDSHFGGSSL